MPRLAGILTLPIITRYLTTVDYGVAGVVSAYIVALSLIQSLGLSVVMVNSFARFPSRFKWIWRQLHGFILLWSVLYTPVLVGVLYFGIPAEAYPHRWEIIALTVIPAVLFANTELLGNVFCQMSQRPLPVALRSFVVGGLVVVLNIYTIAYLRLGYMGWFYANFFGSVVGFFLNGYTIYLQEHLWPIFRFNWHRIKASLRVSLPVVPHNLSFFFLDASDRLVMDVLRVPLPQIGLYNIASSFGLYFQAASNAIVQAASPHYIQLYAKPADREAALQARNMTFALQVLFLLGTFLLSLWLKEIFVLLIKNKALQAAYPLGVIILMGYNYKPMYLAVMHQLVYLEKTKLLWRVSTVAGVGNMLLNLIFVPLFGIEAAAYTTFASLMYMGYSGYLLKDFRQVTSNNYHPWLWFSVTVLALLTVYGLADADLDTKVAVTLVLGIVSGLLFFRTRKVLFA